MEYKLKIDNTLEDLKEAEEIYCQSLNMDGFEDLEFPSLKYTVFNMKISRAFRAKIANMEEDIILLKNKLNNYKGDKIDPAKENENLDDIYQKLTSLEDKDKEEEKFYEKYLIMIAKRADTLKNEPSKKVYIGSSEEILKNRIEYFLKCEKKFLIYNDKIKLLKKFFNI